MIILLLQVLQLRLSHNSSGQKAYRNGSLSESDDDTDEELENPETLNQTLSDIIEGKSSSRVLSSSPDKKIATSPHEDQFSNKNLEVEAGEEQCIDSLSPICSPSKVQSSNNDCDTDLSQANTGAVVKSLLTNGNGAQTLAADNSNGLPANVHNGEMGNVSQK